MNKHIYLIASSTIALTFLCACNGNKNNQETNVEERVFQMKTDTETGLHRMQPSSSEGEAIFKGVEYQFNIERTPCDSLPKVKDEYGDVYVDNVVRLTITRKDGRKLCSKQLVKKHFEDDLPQSMRKGTILEGFVFDEEQSKGLGYFVFAASVCVPQTDYYFPLKVFVLLDGKMEIHPDEDYILDMISNSPNMVEEEV